jgi:hypothetical protein
MDYIVNESYSSDKIKNSNPDPIDIDIPVNSYIIHPIVKDFIPNPKLKIQTSNIDRVRAVLETVNINKLESHIRGVKYTVQDLKNIFQNMNKKVKNKRSEMVAELIKLLKENDMM